MKERALMGTMFAAGVLTAVVAGLGGWQLGRPRTASPTESASTVVPPDSDAPVGRPAAPASDVPPAPSARVQRPSDQQPAALRPLNRPAETAAVAVARAGARPTPPSTARAAVPPGPRVSEAPERRAVAALRPLEVALAVPAAPAATALALRPAEPAEAPRPTALTNPGPARGAQRSTALLAAEPPAPAVPVAPSAVDPDGAPSRPPGSAAVPARSAEAAAPALSAPAPALQAPVAAPFVVSVILPGAGEAHAGAVAAPTVRQASKPVAATARDPVLAPKPSVRAPPAAPPVAAPTPATLTGPAAGPSLAVVAPVEAEVTAAIPPAAGTDLPPVLSRAPPTRAGSPDKRRRHVLRTPRDPDLVAPAARPRAARALRRSARHRPVMDGGLPPRPPVTVVYGTVPPPEFGPVLIRIDRAGRGRIRVSRIPLH